VNTPPHPPTLGRDELVALVRRVFAPRPDDRAIAVIVDLPDERTSDSPDWAARRALAADWAATLAAAAGETGLPAGLFLYRNVGANNADLPSHAWHHAGGPLPATADELPLGAATTFAQILARHTIVIAPTEFSTTAPLKLAAPGQRFRAATMPGFLPSMVPALRLDWEAIDRRVRFLKALLDPATGATLRFVVDGGREHVLHLDLRHRSAHASGGVLREPGTAGNLPSGETYIVPYEGEHAGDPSRSEGALPVQLGPDVVVYRVEGNRAVSVEGEGATAAREAERLRAEPAYGNLAELGLGVLDDLGIAPTGSILLDEKLGLHIAFGRSDHFGGQVGAAQFSRPEAVVHIDRVYLPSLQPRISVREVVLHGPAGDQPLLRDDRYVVAFP
jgi:hypothetical protein